jgi:beta-glucosidase
MITLRAARLTLWAALGISLCAAGACAQRHSRPQAGDDVKNQPWMNTSLSPDQRADMVLKQMTLDEKLDLVHGQGMPGWGPPRPNWYLGNGGAGFVLGVPRLGIPMIQMSDAAYGVRSSAQNGRYSTALPSDVAAASSWDPEAACAYGKLIGTELRDQGYNMTLGGGVNLTRDPRNGRTFEYMGEDPVLAGTMVGNRIKCEQAQYVIGDIKHFALNDQESGRNEVNVVIGDRAMRESDLLAFHIGIEIGHPGAVMCSYNAVNGDFDCENKHLLTDILKDDWKFPGFVLSDWGGTHSTVKASAAGLDNEEPLPIFYGDKLKQAIQSGQVPMAQLDDHVRRILRSEFASGIVDHPVEKGVVDVEGDLAVSEHIAEHSMVLLKNADHVLPLHRTRLHSIAVIGEHADTGMISGGGSAQVDPPGPPHQWQAHVWFPTSPLKAIKAEAEPCATGRINPETGEPDAAPGVNVQFDSGADPASAAALASKSDVALVFAHQWTSEGMDLPSLSLPDHQDALIEQVAAANPHTVVILETGTAVTMPWLSKVAGVLEAWYAGSKGADAVAAILFGEVNPSAKLPMTFPRSVEDLPHPELVQPPHEEHRRMGPLTEPTFSVKYDEGMKVGYKWFDAENKPVLFPFGFGLSYTTYAYSHLKAAAGSGNSVTVSFNLKNTGSRPGAEIAEVYAALPASADEPPKRLVGWSKVELNAGESRDVSVTIDPMYLSIYDESAKAWKLVPGTYNFMVGGSSRDLPLTEKLDLK